MPIPGLLSPLNLFTTASFLGGVGNGSLHLYGLKRATIFGHYHPLTTTDLLNGGYVNQSSQISCFQENLQLGLKK